MHAALCQGYYLCISKVTSNINKLLYKKLFFFFPHTVLKIPCKVKMTFRMTGTSKKENICFHSLVHHLALKVQRLKASSAFHLERENDSTGPVSHDLENIHPTPPSLTEHRYAIVQHAGGEKEHTQ